MIAIRCATVFILIFLAVGTVFAEGGCPDGYFPVGGGSAGWQGCAPMDGGNSQPQANLGPEWATRWGAIAHDGEAGRFGGAEGLSSKRKAEKAAIKECKKNGGRVCKVKISYYNQCGAMAWGNGFLTSARGPQQNAVIQDAVDTCNKKGGSCQPYYSGCSYPERVR
jgi:Domain of unknown function (DUF4189)